MLEQNNEKRNSSIELLRIISMIMIIAHHYAVHGNYAMSKISLGLISIQIFGMFGQVANYIFVFITGYFLVKSKPNFKKILYLILEMEFYSIICYIAMVLVGEFPFNVNLLIQSLIPILYGNWFIKTYIVLYLFIPFINKMIDRLDQKEFKKLLLLMLLIFVVIPTIAISMPYEVGNLLIFIFAYMVGAYIALYPNKYTEDIQFNIKGSLIFITLLVLSVIVIDIIGILMKSTYLLNKSMHFGNKYSIFTFLLAMFVFLVFKNIKFTSNLINNIATSTLGIYLIHDNIFIRNWLWNVCFPNSNYLNSNYIYVHFFVKVMMIYIVCLIIDKIRMIFEKAFQKDIDNLYNSIINFITKYLERKNIKL